VTVWQLLLVLALGCDAVAYWCAAPAKGSEWPYILIPGGGIVALLRYGPRWAR